jgi:hypothetical protein
MSSFAIEAERIANILEFLDDNIQYLSDIYKCPCESCIKSNTERIISIIDYIISFYKFIIRHKNIIKQNENYFILIKNLLSNMFEFNNVVFKDDESQNIIYFNIQKSVSIIYLENEEDKLDENLHITNNNSIFTLSTLIKYYPELSNI